MKRETICLYQHLNDRIYWLSVVEDILGVRVDGLEKHISSNKHQQGEQNIGLENGLKYMSTRAGKSKRIQRKRATWTAFGVSSIMFACFWRAKTGSNDPSGPHMSGAAKRHFFAGISIFVVRGPRSGCFHFHGHVLLTHALEADASTSMDMCC